MSIFGKSNEEEFVALIDVKSGKIINKISDFSLLCQEEDKLLLSSEILMGKSKKEVFKVLYEMNVFEFNFLGENEEIFVSYLVLCENKKFHFVIFTKMEDNGNNIANLKYFTISFDEKEPKISQIDSIYTYKSEEPIDLSGIKRFIRVSYNNQNSSSKKFILIHPEKFELPEEEIYQSNVHLFEHNQNSNHFIWHYFLIPSCVFNIFLYDNGFICCSTYSRHLLSPSIYNFNFQGDLVSFLPHSSWTDDPFWDVIYIHKIGERLVFVNYPMKRIIFFLFFFTTIIFLLKQRDQMSFHLNLNNKRF